jgi:TorA maturation chaperone TorD
MPTPSENIGTDATAESGDHEVVAALARATLYSALALGFRRPSPETVERLTEGSRVAALLEAAVVLQHEDGDLVAAVRALGSAPTTLDRLASRHRRLFGHTVRGEVPAYETEYGNEALFQQPQELSDLAGFFGAFGLARRPGEHERIDHVSCECEFLSFLGFKEAYAREHRDCEMLVETVRAQKLFLRDHLGRMLPAFARRLTNGAVDAGLYGDLGRLLLALVSADCRRHGVPAGSEGLGLRPDPASCAAPMGCSAASDTGGCPPAGAT